MDIITTAEAQQLASARGLLCEIQLRIASIGLDRDPQDNFDRFNCGRAEERADLAADAIFNLLNCMSSHLLDPIAKEFVHSRGES